MTVDVATLVFEFKSDSAKTAEQRMDALIAKGEKLEATAKKVRLATDRVNDGHRGAAGAAERSTQANMALAGSEGAVERATRSAGQASAQTRAQRQLEAAAMRELAQAHRQYERDAARTKAAVDALRMSVDPLRAAVDRANAEMAEANRLHSIGAIDAKEHAQAIAALTARIATLNSVSGASVGSMRTAQRAGVDLSRQFADVGVQAAMMTNPLMILIMQGPQIADTLGVMKREGIGVGAAFKEIGAFLGPVMAMLAPAVAVLAGVAAGFGLLHRELSKGYPDDITKGLGLTEEQLDRVKSKTVTFGDTVMATFTVAGRHIMNSPVGDALRWLGEFFSKTMDVIARSVIDVTALTVGAFNGAFKAVMATWASFPAVFSDLVVSGVNLAIGAINGLVNRAIDGINGLLDRAKALGVNLPRLGQMSIGTLQNNNAGAAAGALDTGATAFREGFASGFRGVRQGASDLAAEIRAEALARAQRRAREEAGKANKGGSAPRDVTDERSAEIARLIAQAQQDELRARLALATGATERAELEKRIIDFGLAEKTAEIQGRIAKIEDDKANTKAKEQILALVGLGLKQGEIASLQKQAVDRQRDEQISRQAHAVRMGELDLSIELRQGQAGLLKSTYARNVAELEILKLQQQQERLGLEEVVRRGVLGGYSAQEVELAQRRLATLGEIHATEIEQASQQARLLDAIADAADSVRGFKNAFGRGDFRGALNGLLSTIQAISASFAANGAGGGLMTLGSAAGAAVGGRTGSAIGGGLGIAASGAMLGSALTGTGALAMGLTSTMGALGVGIGAQAGIMGMVGAIAPMLGPLALAAGALYAAAKIFNVGGKPTNAGAGVDLVTGQLSGNKRTQETEQAATAAADAIKAMQEALKFAGVELPVIVKGLVLGTRDQTQIYLSNGETLRSAVGDSGAAVDAAMKALLDSAVYASDAQRQVAEAAIAAGKGIEGLTEALAKYDAAQKITGALADQILQLTDPQAYETKAVRDAIAEERKAAEQLAKDGYLTAAQLATINGQLSTLESLQLAEVMKRFAEAVTETTTQVVIDLTRDREEAARAVSNAQSALVDAYNREVGVHRDAIERYRQIATGLKAFGRELTMGALAANDPMKQYRLAKSEFDRIDRLAADDPTRLANLEMVGRAFVEASRNASPTQQALERDISRVRLATEASEAAANAQADLAQQQLDALTVQVSLLVSLNANVLTVAQAIAGLQSAVAVATQLGVPANDNSFNATDYLARHPDVLDAYMTGAHGSRQFASAAEWAYAFHQSTGRLHGYAAGGDHPGGWRIVGEEGPEIEATGPARYFSAQKTREIMSGGGGGEVNELRKEVASLRYALETIAVNTGKTARVVEKQDKIGVYVRGQQPGDPVETEAA